MIWLGLKKQTRGYGRAVNEYHRHGKPLPKKMVKPLAREVAAARAELARIEQAIEGKKSP